MLDAKASYHQPWTQLERRLCQPFCVLASSHATSACGIPHGPILLRHFHVPCLLTTRREGRHTSSGPGPRRAPLPPDPLDIGRPLLVRSACPALDGNILLASSGRCRASSSAFAVGCSGHSRIGAPRLPRCSSFPPETTMMATASKACRTWSPCHVMLPSPRK